MKKSIFVVAVLAVLAVFNFSASAPESQTHQIVTKMLNAMNSAKSYTYTMKSLERINGMKNLRGGDIYTKVNVNPQKLYLKMITDPNKGTEILYVKGERDGKALVNPGKMLPTLKFLPTNSMLTKDQHHIVTTSGFSTTARIMGDAVKRADAQAKFDSVFKYPGDVEWAGRKCYKIVIEDPTWTYTTYKALPNEKMYDIATKLLIPEYSLVELNGVKNFEENLGGRTLKVPTSYAKKTILFVDKQTFFPILQEMQDDKGIFEHYEFSNLVINPTFKDDEFTEDFSDYGF